MNDFLRNECKTLKVFQGISYKELAEYLEIKHNSLDKWVMQFLLLWRNVLQNSLKRHWRINYERIQYSK